MVRELKNFKPNPDLPKNAKRAVELTIEQNEDAALRYIEEQA